MRVIIDRFEEDKAVVELNDTMLSIPRVLFPEAHEGDTVEITVLGKEDPDAPHALFEHLRKKSNSRKKRSAPVQKHNNSDGSAPPTDVSETSETAPENRTDNP